MTVQSVSAPSSAGIQRRHRKIADYGFVGGARGPAGVSTVGWFCSRRSISPGRLAKLLDDDNSGYPRIVPETDSSDEGGL